MGNRDSKKKSKTPSNIPKPKLHDCKTDCLHDSNKERFILDGTERICTLPRCSSQWTVHQKKLYPPHTQKGIWNFTASHQKTLLSILRIPYIETSAKQNTNVEYTSIGSKRKFLWKIGCIARLAMHGLCPLGIRNFCWVH